MGDRPWSACFARITLQFFVRTVLNPGGPPAHSICHPSMALVARYAMMSIVPTLLVAVVTFIAIMSSAGPPATGGGLGCGAVSRFVSGKLSSRGCPAAGATKSCREAGLGFREVHVEARAGDVMAGAGGAAGPAQDVRHQPPGEKECCERKNNTYTVWIQH
jgi:hypothetical protein